MEKRADIKVTSSLAESFDDDKTKRSSSDLELFEGDMLLTKEQIQAAVNGQNPSNVGGARGLSSTYMKWPRGIVYYTIDTLVGQVLAISEENNRFLSVLAASPTAQLFMRLDTLLDSSTNKVDPIAINMWRFCGTTFQKNEAPSTPVAYNMKELLHDYDLLAV
ncbi:hypothetical protein OS493_017641 [Desmophyllum pertusum]|uniref:Uncharacterized protein n=1 Tax=Desmophyllum pertusum TaxID=174260 RepID=A0A9W9ZCD5_9CNID|nr:hypothetical protein OS493_017641 [Desmophyllum pertusum]